MKLIVSAIAALLVFGTSTAQQVVNEAVIQMKTETSNPNSDGAPPVSNDGEGRMMVRIGDGEIKSKMFFKNGMTKIESDMGMGTNQVIIDSKEKKTTTLFEAMGRKMGFYTTEADMQRMMAGADSGRSPQQRMQQFNPEVFIEYLSETKKIAGMECKKALIRYKDRRGQEVQQEVWYSPEFVFGEGFRIRDVMRMANVPGLEKLKGFPMEFELTRQNGAKVHYQVTKVDLGAKVDDKVFVIPKDYDIKPMSEMNQGGGRNGFQFRVNGGGQ
jgi:GLPGLI family protein